MEVVVLPVFPRRRLHRVPPASLQGGCRGQRKGEKFNAKYPRPAPHRTAHVSTKDSTSLRDVPSAELTVVLVSVATTWSFHLRSALCRVQPVRGKNGPPLRVDQQLRGLRQPPTLRGVRDLPAMLRGPVLLCRDALAGGGAFFAGESSRDKPRRRRRRNEHPAGCQHHNHSRILDRSRVFLLLAFLGRP